MSREQNKIHRFFHDLDISALLTVIGIILIFSISVIVVLIAPQYVDPSWTDPSSPYQVQMYDVADPNFYISRATSGGSSLQFVQHVKKGYTLSAFHETEGVRIVAPQNLEKFITRVNDTKLKLTSEILLLRSPQKSETFDAVAKAEEVKKELQNKWEKRNPRWREEEMIKPTFQVLELYSLESSSPGQTEAFVVANGEGIIENWVDKDFEILDEKLGHPYHQESGVIYVNNPIEYRYASYLFGDEMRWFYDPKGEPLKNIDDLKNHSLGFKSRKELIALGEEIYAIEGCWYCHTDQTRTLVQDVVLNGSDSYPAPPSAANEYIYQRITFPGTRRIGPDISRVAIKRPSRDWHKGHFWAPRTASQGSIMPAFRHFFDDDPRGTGGNQMGIPNYRFEAMFQYLMTKGTRITPPTQAWWQGKDPVKTKEIIEGKRKLPK